jgi:hypothetical protein
MATLTIKLKQHTPIIHFQHYQGGATLRASELKPKLDKFLIAKFEKTSINYNKWLIGKSDSHSLNYKLKILCENNNLLHYIEEPKRNADNSFKQKTSKEGEVSTETYSYPLFFGNMGKDYYENSSIKKFLFTSNVITLNISSFNSDLLEKIKKYFAEFIAQENFGSRQDKGFGSFYIHKDDVNFQTIDETLFDYKFEINSDKTDLWDKYQSIFEQLDLFYRALRPGLNLKKPIYVNRNGKRVIKKDVNGLDEYETTFYFKSLLFLYFKNQNIQWEKKMIKEKFFPKDGKYKDDKIMYYGLETQKSKYPKSAALSFSNNNKKLVKDLLGLSTDESWQYYKNSITKTEAKDDHKTKKDEKDEQIRRFKSPIFFKIIEDITNGKFTVYIKLNEDIPIKGKWFIIENKYKDNFPLQIPEDFSLHKFFQFIADKDNFNIENYIDEDFKENGKRVYEILKNIFNGLCKIDKTN